MRLQQEEGNGFSLRASSKQSGGTNGDVRAREDDGVTTTCVIRQRGRDFLGFDVYGAVMACSSGGWGDGAHEKEAEQALLLNHSPRV